MDSPKPTMDLEKELTCSICTDLLYQPLTLLDCLHTFCGACLKEWFSWQALAAETSPTPPAPGAPVFTCPSCRDPVRSTRHNATVVTLLDMLLTAQPEKRKPDSEKAEMDSKYKPGDNVLPKLRLPKRTREQERLDEAERRLIDEVRELSRQEAVAAAGGAATGSSSHRSRLRVRRDSGSRPRTSSRSHSDPHYTRGSAREARRRQRQLAAETGASGADSASDEEDRLAVHGSGHVDRHRSASRHSPEASNVSSPSEESRRMVGHQSSLRSLISGSHGGPSSALDIEREIEEFARQIQEEGILDGLDLDNIDVTNNDELSRKIAEAYQRRQRGRARQNDSARHDSAHHDSSRHDGASRRRTTSNVSHRSDNPPTSAPALGGTVPAPSARPEHSPRPSTLTVAAARPPPSSRTSSRQRSHSQSSHRSRSSTGGQAPSVQVATGSTDAVSAQPSRPPISNASSHLEVRDDPRHHQRRRTASEGRTSSMPITPAAEPMARPNARSQTDLSLRPAVQPANSTGLRPPSATSNTSRPGTSSSANAQHAYLPSPSPSSSSSSLASPAATSPTVSSFHARALAAGIQGAAPQQQQQSAPPVELPTPGDEQRNRQPAATSTASTSTTGASSRPSAPHVSTRTITPPPVSANFAQSPVTLDHYETPPLSPQIFSQQQQQQGRPGHRRTRSTLYPEPDITCARCGRTHIEYDVHYNCAVCRGGDWNICLACYRAGRGCQHWFGFGYAAWQRWEKAAARQRDETHPALRSSVPPLSKPHMLTANRYVPPRVVPGGADGRRTLTNEDPQDRLESGVFCAGCQAWANSCYWRCDACNEGDWGFCNDCVNQGRACTHPLLPLTHAPLPAAATASTAATSASAALPSPPPRPRASSLLQRPADGAADAASSSSSTSSTLRIGSFRALTFTTTCDLCRKAIPAARARFHCYACTSAAVPDTHPGDYDVCQECYAALPAAGQLAPENGPAGWRRCPAAGHRMVVVAFREDGKGHHIPRRVVVQDLVGGWRLQVEAAAGAVAAGPASEARTTNPEEADLQTWYVWYNEKRLFERTVARDVRIAAAAAGGSGTNASGGAAPLTSPTGVPLPPEEAPFPPSGGVGRVAVARWAYYPEAGADDELAFPKLAEIREIEDVNGEWFYGVYMGRKGLFPGGYVQMLGP